MKIPQKMTQIGWIICLEIGDYPILKGKIRYFGENNYSPKCLSRHRKATVEVSEFCHEPKKIGSEPIFSTLIIMLVFCWHHHRNAASQLLASKKNAEKSLCAPNRRGIDLKTLTLTCLTCVHLKTIPIDSNRLDSNQMHFVAHSLSWRVDAVLARGSRQVFIFYVYFYVRNVDNNGSKDISCGFVAGDRHRYRHWWVYRWLRNNP